MAISNNWYVITGGPSSGKTTLLNELAKLGHKTMPEAARSFIDQAFSKGITSERLRADEKLFQEKIVQLKVQIERSLPPRTITFLDRGMHDTLAYLQYYNFPIESWVKHFVEKAEYKRVFILEPLPKYEKDYARVESADFPTKIHNLLYDAYKSCNMDPILVPAFDVPTRVNFILQKVKEQRR